MGFAELFKTDMPVAFYFNVKLMGLCCSDTSFMEVSGLSTKIDTEKYKEGGNLSYVYNLPIGIKYENLVLKRGISAMTSVFSQWCYVNLMSPGMSGVVTAELEVNLLDKDNCPLRTWYFTNAYPVKWSVDQLNSKKNDLAIETIEICYSYATRG